MDRIRAAAVLAVRPWVLMSFIMDLVCSTKSSGGEADVSTPLRSVGNDNCLGEAASNKE
jgi:hypothetical protein